MSIKSYLIDFIVIFIVILVISTVVSYLYSLLVHGAGNVDWGDSIISAIMVGIVFSWIFARLRKKKEKQPEKD